MYDPEVDAASALRAQTEQIQASSAAKQQRPRIQASVFGRSLAGFEVNSKPQRGSPKSTSSTDPDLERQINNQLQTHYPPGKPLSLQAQVHATQLIIQIYLSYLYPDSRLPETSEKHSNTTRPRPKLILIGHSVGAYIALELIKQQHSRNPSSSPLSPHIIGAVLLFPTITHIARSPRGRSLAPLLSRPVEKLNAYIDTVSLLATLLHGLVLLLRVVLALCGATLEGMIARVKDMTPEAARVTVGFLRSRAAVRQCLFMGRSELREITEDKWGREVWGAAYGEESGVVMDGANGIDGAGGGVGKRDKVGVERWVSPKLILHFGRRDHWVAEKEREALIRRRGDGVIDGVSTEEAEVEELQANGHVDGLEEPKGAETSARPRFVLDDDGIPHGFSIRHSRHVAERCAAYVEEIV